MNKFASRAKSLHSPWRTFRLGAQPHATARWSHGQSNLVAMLQRNIEDSGLDPTKVQGRLSAATQEELRALAASIQAEATAGPTPRPSGSALKTVALACAIPAIGFGFVDNLIMIVAGDSIDHSIGVVMGISTMAAAGLGNLCSDVAGVGLQGFIEQRLGIKLPRLSRAQLALPVTKFWEKFGQAMGISLGCLLGMLPLLFLDPEKARNESIAISMSATNCQAIESTAAALRASSLNMYYHDTIDKVLFTHIHNPSATGGSDSPQGHAWVLPEGLRARFVPETEADDAKAAARKQSRFVGLAIPSPSSNASESSTSQTGSTSAAINTSAAAPPAAVQLAALAAFKGGRRIPMQFRATAQLSHTEESINWSDVTLAGTPTSSEDQASQWKLCDQPGMLDELCGRAVYDRLAASTVTDKTTPQECVVVLEYSPLCNEGGDVVGLLQSVHVVDQANEPHLTTEALVARQVIASHAANACRAWNAAKRSRAHVSDSDEAQSKTPGLFAPITNVFVRVGAWARGDDLDVPGTDAGGNDEGDVVYDLRTSLRVARTNM